MCVGPRHADRDEDFFGELKRMLLETPDVTDMHPVPDAHVPVMRFKFNGVSIDLLYAKLSLWVIPDDLDIIIIIVVLFKGHMLKLKGTLMLATPDEIAVIHKIKLQSSEKSKLTRDHNGFRRLLVVLTKPGKLFALHTGYGRVFWSSLLQSFCRSEQCADLPTGLKLHQWQIPHHHALDNNPSVLVVGRCGLSLTSPSSLSIIDAYTGKEIQTMGPTHSAVQVISLPFSDSSEQQLHLLIDAEKRAHLYPRTPEAPQIFKGESENVYWYSVEAKAGILRGYGVKSSCNVDVTNDEYCFETKNLWSIVFPSESGKIIATVTRKENEIDGESCF